MQTIATGSPPGSPNAGRYDLSMATKTVLMGIEKVRLILGDRSKVAAETGEHTIMTRFGQSESAIVPMEWYRKARKSLGEPTDL